MLANQSSAQAQQIRLLELLVNKLSA